MSKTLGEMEKELFYDEIMNKIHNVDCLEFMRKIPDDYFDLVLTDIPYGEANRKNSGLRNLDKGAADVVNFDINELLFEISRICSGSFIIFCGFQQLSTIDSFMRDNNISRRCLVWEKTNPSPMNAQHLFVSGVELAVYGKKPNAYYDGEYSNTVFRYKAGESKVHPTQKPIDLWSHIMRKVVNNGMKVFDPFMGSGTTAIACKSLGLEWCGCELEADYVEIANKRLEQVQGSLF